MTSEEPPEKIRKMELPRFKVIPILDSSLTCETVPSTSFQALRVNNKKLIGQIISHLKDLPEDFQHLKRVGKDGSVLISKHENEAEQIVMEMAHADVQLNDLMAVKVPLKKPSTRRQFNFAKTLWPTGFHPNHDIEKLLDGSFLTDALREYINIWTQRAINLGNGCIAVQYDSERITPFFGLVKKKPIVLDCSIDDCYRRETKMQIY